MQARGTAQPMLHFAIASVLVVLAFAVCEVLHWLGEGQAFVRLRPEVHPVFLPHGVVVLLAWVYGWAMVPLALPAFLLCAAFVVGPDYMTPVVATLSVSRLVMVMLGFELMRSLSLDPRGDAGRRGLMGIFAAGTVASMAHNVLRIGFGHCCEVMTLPEKLMSYAVAVGADVVGLVLVLLAAMMLFRALRH